MNPCLSAAKFSALVWVVVVSGFASSGSAPAESKDKPAAVQLAERKSAKSVRARLKRIPKPGRYVAKLGDSGTVSFKIDRTGRYLSNVRIYHAYQELDGDGNVSQPLIGDFDSGNRRRRVARKGGIDFTFVTRNGDFSTIFGKMQGRARYNLIVQMFLSRRVEFFDPETHEFVGSIDRSSPGILRTTARPIRYRLSRNRIAHPKFSAIRRQTSSTFFRLLNAEIRK